MSDEPREQPTNIAPHRVAEISTDLPAANDSPPPSRSTAREVRRSVAVSGVRFAIAMAVALLADTVGYPVSEFAIIAFDVGIALILALCLRGFRPEIIIACVIEAIPGLGLFPSWSLAVPAIWARMKLGGEGSDGTARRQGSD